jgi:branched-chain amino acid aminotransferase
MTATASAPQASKTSSSNQATPQFPVTRTPNPRPKPADEGLGFGTAFTDHMFMMDYVEGAGWHEGRIEPYGTIPMDPAAAVLHYAQAVFDGLKAFRGVDGKIRVFRPDKHVARLISSCERMCIPEMDHETTLQSLLQLVRVEKDWVPRAPGTALYLRPTIVATEAFLGVRPAKEYVYFVICSPVGAYYKEGFGPVKIRVAEITCGQWKVAWAPPRLVPTTPRASTLRSRRSTRATPRCSGSMVVSVSTWTKWGR